MLFAKINKISNWQKYTDYEVDGIKPNGTRSSADADNRRSAFSGQSRSTNMVPF